MEKSYALAPLTTCYMNLDQVSFLSSTFLSVKWEQQIWITKFTGILGQWIKNTVGFPCGSAGKESTCNTGDLGLTPGLGWSPG